MLFEYNTQLYIHFCTFNELSMLGWMDLPNNFINTIVIFRSCYPMGQSFSSSSGNRHNYVNAKIIKIQNVCVCLGLSRNLFLFLSRNTVRNSFLYFSTDPTKCTLYRVMTGKLVQDDATVHLLVLRPVLPFMIR